MRGADWPRSHKHTPHSGQQTGLHSFDSGKAEEMQRTRTNSCAIEGHRGQRLCMPLVFGRFWDSSPLELNEANHAPRRRKRRRRRKGRRKKTHKAN